MRGRPSASIPGRTATADTEPDSRREWFRQHGSGRYPLWVAERERRVVGWLSFGVFHGRPAYAATAEVSVYVAPEHHRQGIGSELVREALAGAGAGDREPPRNDHNQPSLQLFTNFGFECRGLLPRVAELDGVKRDLVITGRHVLARGDEG